MNFELDALTDDAQVRVLSLHEHVQPDLVGVRQCHDGVGCGTGSIKGDEDGVE